MADSNDAKNEPVMTRAQIGSGAVTLILFGIGYFCGANFFIPASAAFAISYFLTKTKLCKSTLINAVISLNCGYAIWFLYGALRMPELNFDNTADPITIVLLTAMVAIKEYRWAAYTLAVYHLFGLCANVYMITDAVGPLSLYKALTAHIFIRLVCGGVTVLLIYDWRQVARQSIQNTENAAP